MCTFSATSFSRVYLEIPTCSTGISCFAEEEEGGSTGKTSWRYLTPYINVMNNTTSI